MKKELTILLVAICFVTLAAMVIADNETEVGNNITNKTSPVIKIGNMTFGKCVAEASQLRQGCYAEEKNISKQCTGNAKQGKNKTTAKQCVSSYKESQKSCKANFKEAKTTCIQTYKPGFWERMRNAFK